MCLGVGEFCGEFIFGMPLRGNFAVAGHVLNAKTNRGTTQYGIRTTILIRIEKCGVQSGWQTSAHPSVQISRFQEYHTTHGIN